MTDSTIDAAAVRKRDELFALGKSRRKESPRSGHDAFVLDPDRPSIVAFMEDSDAGRVPDLVRVRHARMLESPLAFYRGLPSVMIHDLAKGTPVSGLRVQCCGDCHLENFGIFATPERNVVFDINDFDETLPGPWEWDLKRLLTSFVLAGRMNGLRGNLPGTVARRVIEAYKEQMFACAEMTAISVWYSRIDASECIGSMDPAAWSNKVVAAGEAPLAQHVRVAEKITVGTGAARRIAQKPPDLFHVSEEDETAEHVNEMFDAYRTSLRDDVELLLRRYTLTDLAVKVVGVGSVGTRCAVALLLASDDDPLILQIKEANASILERYLPKSIYESHGQRVVAGQQLLQAASDMFLGWSSTESGHEYYVRQLKDGKASINTAAMSEADLERYAALCGRALAIGHSRSGEPASIAGYLGKGPTFDDAVVRFALTYANQVEADYIEFKDAVTTHRILV